MSSHGRYSKATNWLKGAYIAFFGGPKKPVIEGEIEVGRGKMRVWVVLTDELLREIAGMAVYVLAEPDLEHRGHAFWHSQNKEREYPCGDCTDAVKAKAERWLKRIESSTGRLSR